MGFEDLLATTPVAAVTRPVLRLLVWIIGGCLLWVFWSLLKVCFQMLAARNSAEGAESARPLLFVFGGLLVILSAAEIILAVRAY
jgi:hypothetical protein